MIKALSDGVAKWLEKEGAVPSPDQGLFSYAVYSFLFGLLPILLAFVLGILFGMRQESLLMILPFMVIRKFSGGFHLNSAKKCFAFSSVLLSLAMWEVKILIAAQSTIHFSLLVSLSALSLWVLSPIDNKARNLSESEKKHFRKIAQILSVGIWGVYLVLQVCAPKTSSVPVGVGIVLAAVLQLPCIPRKLTKCNLPDNNKD